MQASVAAKEKSCDMKHFDLILIRLLSVETRILSPSNNA